MIQEAKLPDYTPEENAFMSGWHAASKLLSKILSKEIENLRELENWLDEWTTYVEYDNCMDALSTWQEENKKHG